MKCKPSPAQTRARPRTLSRERDFRRLPRGARKRVGVRGWKNPMTRASAAATQPALGLWPVWRRLTEGNALPVATVVALILLLWYAAAIWLNGPQVRDQLTRAGKPYTVAQFVNATWSMERPVLPTPGQIGAEFKKTVFDIAPTSKRSLRLSCLRNDLRDRAGLRARRGCSASCSRSASCMCARSTAA